MSDKGTGRSRSRASRGRSRGTPASSPPQQAAKSPSEETPPVGRGPPSAWSPRPQPGEPTRPQQVSAWGKQRLQQQTPQSQPQQPSQPTSPSSQAEAGLTPGVKDISAAFRGMQMSSATGGASSASGDASSATGGASSDTGGASATGDRPTYLKRGNLRGRLEINKPFITKPSGCNSKIGVDGTFIKVVTNHFRLIRTMDWSLCQYWVDFSPEEDRNKIRKALLRDHRDVIGDGYMFDGAMLFTVQRIHTPGQKEVLELFSIREGDKAKIRLSIKFVGELALGDYQYIQLFNIIVRNCIDSMDFQLVGREYFDPRLKEDLTNFNLEIWPGYVTSILQFEQNIMMCLDVSHKVLRKDTVLELLNDMRKRFRDDWQVRFTQSILGAVVFTHYNNKPYRVDDVDFKSSPTSTFKKGNDDIQYITYYRERYQINIRELRQPLLISRPKARDLRGGRNQNIVLIPELCNMTGLSNEMRTNFQLMRAVADKTRIPPAERINAYYQFLDRMAENELVQTKLSQWKMNFANNLEEVRARRFNPESIVAKKEISYDNSGDWTRSLRGKEMLKSATLTNWVIIASANMTDKRGQGQLENFLAELKKAANSLLFDLPPPEKARADADKPSSFYHAIEKALSKKNIQLVMCVVPNNRTDIYSAIKKKCCIDRPVPSQVIAVKTLTHKNLLSVATKIIIQMNCKLGGVPWYVPLPFMGPNKEHDPSMVVGFDVCHDTSMKGKSHGALVASLDYYYSHYYSAVSQHSFGEELSNDIATHMGHAVIRFREINKKLPSRIIIYRDGVGESNIPFVLKHEVERIKTRLKDIFPGWNAKMVVVIVSKRIQTRIFENNDNPKPGTVVDNVITRPERYDFFLVSQSVKQGTVTPTSYSVIYDTLNWKADIMQKITYKLTHIYYNCSCTVRVPAQVQYAHKLAFLVGQALHQSPSSDLNGQLYFL
uniref:Piwi n=1 Tax=Oncopeltus fasciatus TaxID=7536 RepID=M9VXW7_ONCFA|nr:piwi [Oncopeltus fasciatus]